MPTKGTKTEHETELSDLIRRQIGTQVNRRHLSRLPQFSLHDGMPERLGLLLADLDEAERRLSGRGTPAPAQSGHHWPASAHGRSRE